MTAIAAHPTGVYLDVGTQSWHERTESPNRGNLPPTTPIELRWAMVLWDANFAAFALRRVPALARVDFIGHPHSGRAAPPACVTSLIGVPEPAALACGIIHKRRPRDPARSRYQVTANALSLSRRIVIKKRTILISEHQRRRRRVVNYPSRARERASPELRFSQVWALHLKFLTAQALNGKVRDEFPGLSRLNRGPRFRYASMSLPIAISRTLGSV
jgi:hypothetical protein